MAELFFANDLAFLADSWQQYKKNIVFFPKGPGNLRTKIVCTFSQNMTQILNNSDLNRNGFNIEEAAAEAVGEETCRPHATTTPWAAKSSKSSLKNNNGTDFLPKK